MVLILCIASTTFAKLSKECLVDYLKFRNVHDEIFSSVDSYSGEPTKCTNDVKNKINEIHDYAQSKLEANFQKKPYANCAMTKVRANENYQNTMLIAEVVELKGVGIKFWKIGSKNSKIEELQKQAQEILDNAFIDCKSHTDYGAFFDTFMEQKGMEATTDEYDYCLRRHLVDKLIVSTRQYNFKVNPKNIRTDNIDCKEIIETANQRTSFSIGSAAKPCVINTFIENGYLDTILKLQMLSKLTLSLEEKQHEKQNFIDLMISMTHKVKSCPL